MNKQTVLYSVAEFGYFIVELQSLKKLVVCRKLRNKNQSLQFTVIINTKL